MSEARLEVRVVFRVDASPEIGTGHVVRCLTLAAALRGRGAQCLFISQDHGGEFLDRIRENDFELVALPTPRSSFMPQGNSGNASPYLAWLRCDWQVDAEQTRPVLERDPPKWLIVDHYALDARWESALRPHCRRLLAIDDLADRDHNCDLLLDQNLQEDGRYANRIPKRCRTLIGPKYALLRPQFALARKRQPVRHGQVSRILVFFGGVDSSGETQKALAAIEMLDRPDLAIDVVIGRGNPHYSAIQEICRRLVNNVEIYCDVEDMAARMASADLFIGAGGSSSWERCSLGLPSIIMATAENQIPQSEALARAGAQIYLGRASLLTPGDLARSVVEVLRLKELRIHMANQAHMLVDAQGASRVANQLLSDEVCLRRAEIGDCWQLFTWRNHPETRRFSFDSRALDRKTHERWFTAVLSDPDRELLIAEQHGRPIGVLRYDIADARARISVYLVPGMAGQGWGRRILLAGEDWLRERRGNVRVIEAEIGTRNLASLAAFKAAGYHPERSVYRKEIYVEC